MEQTPRQQQGTEQSTIRRPEKIGTPMHEIYASILMSRRFRGLDEYGDDHNDDDSDCYCE